MSCQIGEETSPSRVSNTSAEGQTSRLIFSRSTIGAFEVSPATDVVESSLLVGQLEFHRANDFAYIVFFAVADAAKRVKLGTYPVFPPTQRGDVREFALPVSGPISGITSIEIEGFDSGGVRIIEQELISIADLSFEGLE